MFFRVLSAMLTADAIDRHLRSRSPRYWSPQQPHSQQSSVAPWSPALPLAPTAPRAREWDPHAPERPR